MVAMIVAPLAAMLVQMAISRTREYSADHRGAEISGQPAWLASALDKIARRATDPQSPAERNPATAHLFIINPLSGERMDNLFYPPSTETASRRSSSSRPRWGKGGAGAVGGRPPRLVVGSGWDAGWQSVAGRPNGRRGGGDQPRATVGRRGPTWTLGLCFI